MMSDRMKPTMAKWGKFLVILLLIPLTLLPESGLALVGDSEEAFGLDGSIRSIGTIVQNYDFPLFFGEDNPSDIYSQTILRLTAGGRPIEPLAYEFHLVQSFTYFSGEVAPGFGTFNLAPRDLRYRALDMTWNWFEEDKTIATLWLDRFNVKIALPAADITLGRQAITFGKAYFWNPLDVFLPFDPNQFDRDYKPGVDALRVDIPLGEFSGCTMVGALGRKLDLIGEYIDGDHFFDHSWYGSALLGRIFANFHSWDLVLQGGKIYGGYQLGGGLIGEIKGLEVRGEAAYFWEVDSPSLLAPLRGDLIEDYLTAVVGLGHRFENTLVLELEFLYNGGGETDDLDTAWIRFLSGNILQLGRHLVGFLASYDFLPILIGNFALISSLDDGSVLVQPYLTLSLSDEAELLLGATINVGKRPDGDSLQDLQINSEFGSFPNFYFFEIKYYF
jgi:hypothetical protein